MHLYSFEETIFCETQVTMTSAGTFPNCKVSTQFINNPQSVTTYVFFKTVVLTTFSDSQMSLGFKGSENLMENMCSGGFCGNPNPRPTRVSNNRCIFQMASFRPQTEQYLKTKRQ